MKQITLKCCTCGTTKDIVVTQAPTFGFEVYSIAKAAGWQPLSDTANGRTLCFCSETCMKKQLTKGGFVRKRLLHCPPQLKTTTVAKKAV